MILGVNSDNLAHPFIADECYNTPCITHLKCQECNSALCAMSQCACNLHSFATWQLVMV
jgi:hypothetical protein